FKTTRSGLWMSVAVITAPKIKGRCSYYIWYCRPLKPVPIDRFNSLAKQLNTRTTSRKSQVRQRNQSKSSKMDR
ncbi:hypothetical protein, partial [Chamaesiphon sp. GL140_3_metabinner_50]|uniref:hypothetical protein n=1 Tax=Chamaesiphon sp. GL140_3_metabinner_50 TaxID=2970812 RepID=UPI0025E2EF99